MTKELNYFEIDGAFGGNQEWFTNVVMNIGGCGAATACDCCIYFAREWGLRELYPFDAENLTKEDYKKFSQIMKPYIRPRVGGVKKALWFMEGLGKYIADCEKKCEEKHEETCEEKRDKQKNEHPKKFAIKMEELSGHRSEPEAESLIRSQIDKGLPVPCLMLHHKDKEKFKDFIWHWFLIVGYEDAQDDFSVVIATYGEKTVFSLKELWDTGHEEKGGLVTFHFTNEE